MNPRTPTTEKKTVMSQSNGATEMFHLLNEALSRARMPEPQNSTSEARRSARDVAMQARRRQVREQGSY
jgi:hypothetical protein